MTGCKIDDVNEVANSCAIRRAVVISPYQQPLSLSDGHLRYQGQQVIRNAQWILSDEPAFMRTDWIEVSQNINPPIVVGPIKVFQHLFDKELCAAVRICRSERMLLIKRQVRRHPVNGGGRTE